MLRERELIAFGDSEGTEGVPADLIGQLVALIVTYSGMQEEGRVNRIRKLGARQYCDC